MQQEDAKVREHTKQVNGFTHKGVNWEAGSKKKQARKQEEARGSKQPTRQVVRGSSLMQEETTIIHVPWCMGGGKVSPL